MEGEVSTERGQCASSSPETPTGDVTRGRPWTFRAVRMEISSHMFTGSCWRVWFLCVSQSGDLLHQRDWERYVGDEHSSGRNLLKHFSEIFGFCCHRFGVLAQRSLVNDAAFFLKEGQLLPR